MKYFCRNTKLRYLDHQIYKLKERAIQRFFEGSRLSENPYWHGLFTFLSNRLSTSVYYGIVSDQDRFPPPPIQIDREYPLKYHSRIRHFEHALRNLLFSSQGNNLVGDHFPLGFRNDLGNSNLYEPFKRASELVGGIPFDVMRANEI